jgi:peptidoglycan-N-acetylglucosamine deacetylase
MNPWTLGALLALMAGAALAAYGAVHPRSELFGPTVRRTNSPRKLAITFDDGPNPKITPALLKLLEAHNAHATFFVLGRFAADCPELVRETAGGGHQLGNHSATHANLWWRTAVQIHDELQRCNDAVAEITGYPPSCFRPPFGFRNPWVVSSAAALGLRTIMWTELPGDWRVKPAEWLIQRMGVIGQHARATLTRDQPSRAAHGDILCLHDGDFRFLNGDRTATVEALRFWLPRWRDLGLEFVTIDQAVNPAA